MREVVVYYIDFLRWKYKWQKNYREGRDFKVEYNC
jgi:hypothetical protein